MKEYILRKIKRFVLKATGKVNHLRKGVKCKHVWYGNTYGGFYVNPDLLNENSVIYSFGIGDDISFDTTIIKKHHCHVFGFDPTNSCMEWIKTQKLPETFHFYNFGISSESGDVDFYLPNNPAHTSGSIVVQSNINVKERVTVIMKSLKDIMNELGHSHIDVLKMDIEGAEYEVIENIIAENISASQILIEFHDRFFENGRRKTELISGKLKDKGYEIFAVSDLYQEVSFINTSSLL